MTTTTRIGRYEILEFSGPHDEDQVWYVEGHSQWLAVNEPPGTWFCFESPYHEAVNELLKLGFTNAEINAAKEVKEDKQIGTCGGCGAYGQLGRTHVRNGEECGTYV